MARGRAQEPIALLRDALSDESAWVRMGAAEAIPGLAPESAPALLGPAIERPGQARPIERAIFIRAFFRARGDGAAPLADLLGDRIGTVRELLLGTETDWSEALQAWGDHLQVKARAGTIDVRTGRILFDVLRYAHWGRRPQSDEPPLSERGMRIRRAAHALDFHRSFIGEQSRDQESLARITFAGKALDADDAESAIEPLVAVAIGSSDWHLRGTAAEMLSHLGPAAAEPLMRTLAGSAGPLPDSSTLRSLELEGGGEMPETPSPRLLGRYLASAALEGFKDRETVMMLAAATLGWPPELAAGAVRTLGRMSPIATMPVLAWLAVHRSGEERGATLVLLDKIVDNDESFGVHLHRINSEPVENGSLDWVKDIARRADSDGWLSDFRLTESILGWAVSIVPEIVGKVGIFYSDGTSAARVSWFGEAMRGIARWLPGLHSTRARVPLDPVLRFPASCATGEEYELAVGLAEPPTGRREAAIDVPLDRGTADLLVLVRAPGFEITPDHAVLTVSETGSREPARFRLRARSAGRQTVEVKFLHGTSVLGHSLLTSWVDVAKAPEGPAEIIPIEGFDSSALQRHPDAHAMLLVETDPRGRLLWRAIDRAGAPRLLGSSRRQVEDAAKQDLTRRQQALIRQALSEDLSAADFDGLLAQLSALGSELLGQLAPPEVAGFVNGLSDDALVVIESDADWIPWELLASAPSDRLWGERFMLVRAPLVTSATAAVRVDPSVSRSDLRQALMVIGDEIGNAGYLTAETFGAHARQAETLIDGDWETLRSATAGKDLVHFVCHGRTDPFHLSYGRGVGRRLLTAQVSSLSIEPGAVVFANACGSGSTELFVAEFQSFGRAFYLAGARPFVGTLGPVPEREANAFARLFYRYFAECGLPAGLALKEARRDAMADPGFKVPIWLFYCLYGHHEVSRRWAA